MTAATPSRLGQNLGAGSTTALFLKVFGGEVFTSFLRATAFRERVFARTIDAGLSAQFPILGRRGSPVIYTPGTFLTGGQIQATERVITIEGSLLSDVFVAEIDELMNHYDVRAEYARQLGESIAFDLDFNCSRTLIQTSRLGRSVAAERNPDAPGGARISNASVSGAVNAGSLVAGRGVVANGSDLIEALFLAATQLDANYVPSTERYAFLRPAQWNLLARTDRAIDRDLSGDAAGNLAQGTVQMIAGLPVIKTNHIPSTDESTAGPRVPYRGNYATTVGIISHKSAAGVVLRRDLSLEAEYEIQRQGTLMVAKMACGIGGLRPEAAVELTSDVT